MLSKRDKLSLLLKIIVFICSIVGVIINCLSAYGLYIGPLTTFAYFTIQSNIWIGLIMSYLVVLYIIQYKTKIQKIKRWMYVLKLIFTVSITLTGMVYCFLLAPSSPDTFECWTAANVLTHIVVPLTAIIDWFVDTYKCELNNKNVLAVIIPPLYYLVFSTILYITDFVFVDGQNYPYFFLNYGSPAGIFGFSNEAPYFIGSFYWIIILLIFVLFIGYLYKIINNKKMTD